MPRFTRFGDDPTCSILLPQEVLDNGTRLLASGIDASSLVDEPRALARTLLELAIVTSRGLE